MLSSDMVALEADATMMGRLQTMKRHVEAGRPEDLAHVQTLAAAEPGGLLELEGQPVHANAPPVSALNVPLGQSTQVGLLSVDTSHVAPVNPASHTHTP